MIHMKLEDCKKTDVGTLSDGTPVIVATDSAGSQIIVGNRHHKIHYLSEEFDNHDSAVARANEIVSSGIFSPTINEWCDLNAGGGFPGWLFVATSVEREKLKHA